jgi:periplasmic glucans biosynthesis protein
MNRRQLLAASVALSAAAIAPFSKRVGLLAAEAAAPSGDAPFDSSYVREMARQLAAKPYQPPEETLPDALKDLNYDQYRSIRFLPEHALWRGENRGFEAQFFHRGFYYKNKVQIFQVIDGRASPIKYRQADFSFGKGIGKWPDDDLGFAGFRLHALINQPDYYDEVCVFLGASYFRAVAKNEVYGLSSRGLAIDTGESTGEEFPAFKAFWLDRPSAGATSIVIHALLDSKSAAGSFRLTIRPGATTIFDVEMALFPRVDLPHGGLAPLTSMFFFGPNDPAGVEDFRPQVHDSDGLMMLNGRGEQLWRPLCNPRTLQISAFSDVNPRSFGLVQRARSFADYQDLESHFELRPSLVVEPIGDWGEGEVLLFEIPTKKEIHDNIVAFWRPKDVLAAKREHNYTYRLHWGPDVAKTGKLARFTRAGLSALSDDTRLFVLELIGERLKSVDPKAIKGGVAADKGQVSDIVTQPNPETGGWRLSFRINVKDQKAIEMRAHLTENDTPISEIWVYRWTP